MRAENKILVEQLYRSILNREGDQGGVISATSALDSALDRDAAIIGLVRSFLSSEEYLARASEHPDMVRRTTSYGEKKTVNGMPVKHIISLGTHCLTSSLLRSFGLRRYSLPFDWTFSSPQAMLHCLRDQLQTFLDRAHYRTVTRKRDTVDAGADHVFYLKKFNIGEMFAHRDPSTDSDYADLLKTTERFKRLLASQEPKLFVMIDRPRKRPFWIFRSLSREINRMTQNSAFIYIQLQNPTMKSGIRSIRNIKTIGNHAAYEFIPSSNELGIKFDDPIDNLSIIGLIHQYEIDLADSAP
ncbi:DUF1796 family putative cysteine peptidase [Burkholderia latens]|uniref:Papain-like cysteine peptidase n=1 Tax=Burkholderia latens TaxID=488446 RepID=A0A6H9TFB9_9BURK|nr:DUF1796 family putative cysteine peptidase [Burkholderia latens]KAB0643564.1 hypothetical protein F7R21_06880 [Burkholderia latens]VWB34041.1 hypothetical protein BLA24064_01460 [Burkholderia latens]